jgi:hypothetical protein
MMHVCWQGWEVCVGGGWGRSFLVEVVVEVVEVVVVVVVAVVG